MAAPEADRSCCVSKGSISEAENARNTAPVPLSSFLRPALPRGALGWGRDCDEGKQQAVRAAGFLPVAQVHAE